MKTNLEKELQADLNEAVIELINDNQFEDVLDMVDYVEYFYTCLEDTGPSLNETEEEYLDGLTNLEVSCYHLIKNNFFADLSESIAYLEDWLQD